VSKRSANTDGEGGEHRRAVMIGMAVERFVDMLETGVHRNPVAGQQREFRRAMGEAAYRRAEKLMNVYAVVADGKVVTVGHRTRRVGR